MKITFDKGVAGFTLRAIYKKKKKYCKCCGTRIKASNVAVMTQNSLPN
jgi:hypothetical protein